MGRSKRYPRARLKTAVFDAEVERQGRKVKWVAQAAGVTAVRLRDFRNGLECTYERAVVIARVLGVEVFELFDVIQAPVVGGEGRAA